MLTGIVYLSSAVAPFDEKALRELAEHARERNRELDVTGYLYFEQRQFIQYIEGPDESVTALMQRIAEDRRHEVNFTLYDRGGRGATVSRLVDAVHYERVDDFAGADFA